jgi:hypothetical protein
MLFKKHFVTLIAFFILVSNSGFAFTVHFCDDKVASVSLFENENCTKTEESCCGVVEKVSDCCSDKVIKIEDNSEKIVLKIIQINNFILPTFIDKSISINRVEIQKSANELHYFCEANAPPLYKLYQQYTFYA